MRTILVKTGYGATNADAAPTGLRRTSRQRLRSFSRKQMSRAVGIIPRAGVRRVSRENRSIRSPANRCCNTSGNSCRRAKALDSVIIATDDMRIAEAAFAWGAEVSLTIANTPAEPIGSPKLRRNCADVAHIINIQGDEPLVDPKLDQPTREQNAARSANRDDHRGASIRQPGRRAIAASGQSRPRSAKAALFISRAHAIPYSRDSSTSGEYFRHQGIYGYRRDLLLRFVRWKPSPLERAEALEQLRALGEWRKHSRGRHEARLARRRYAGRMPERSSASCSRAQGDHARRLRDEIHFCYRRRG